MNTIVVGAGAIGLGIAWRAAQQGRDVLVLERDQPGHGASFHAAGMLAPITEATFGEDTLLGLNLTGARAYPAFLADLRAASGLPLTSQAPGTLSVALDGDQLAALRRLHAFQQELGLSVDWLDAPSLRDLEPALHPGVRAGIRAAEQEVDPRELTTALARALAAAGGTLRPQAPVAGLLVTHGRCRGVRLAGGEEIEVADGGCVVLAAGCWSGGIEGVPGHIAGAVRPVKGQILRMRCRAGDPPPVRHLIRTEEVYLVPRASGEIVIGASVEEQGFDTSLTGGGIFELLRAALEVVPAVRELELVEATAGLRPGSRDNAPLLGPAGRGGPEGLVVATGHHRNGILLTAVTAQAIATLIATGQVPPEIAAFPPDRFA